MSLEQLIQTGNYASAQEAFTAITTASVEVRDDQLWTWAGIAKLAGDETADALEQFLVSMGRTWVISQLGGRGLPLSDPKIQEMLLGLAPTIPGCAILAAQGLSLKAPWEAAGLPGAPTQDQVAKAWTVWSTRQQMAAELQVLQAKSSALNAWLDSLDVSTKTTAEVQAYCDSLLASTDGNPSEAT